ncbi:MAG: carboxymuconolactone decarboxylase family protein, partial [Microthrixaceae bacterium]|nr:carboxymuconolactone decarboxylase family protein [Microthrixaceae bacterium]
MPRLRMVPRDELHPFGEVMFGALFGDRDPIEEPGTPSGTPGDWWPVFANSPDCFDHCCGGFQYYRDPKRKLDPKLRELGQTRT